MSSQANTQRNFRLKRITTVLLIAIFLLPACGNNHRFDSAAWLKGDRRARGRMSDDLVKRKILLGQTADEAQRLLGRPDTTYPTALSYKIDLGWILKDPENYGVLVYFDQNRIVNEVKIVD
jgi:hypothetical protein